jgi:hypothetical protein
MLIVLNIIVIYYIIMNNNLGPTGPTATLTTATLTSSATLTTPIKMDPLNQKALNVMLTQGTTAAVKHMFTHETTGQTLTYLEMRERYG